MKLITVLFVGLAMLTACTAAPEQQAPSFSQTDSVQTETDAQTETDTREVDKTKEKSKDDENYTEDIRLSVSEKEITAYKDSGEVIFYAEVSPDFTPEKLILKDSDTNDTVAELFDEADYEKYGDTIKGDSVYNCRFKVNTDINTNDDVSEKAAYHYYASFTDDKGEHRSNTVKIDVFEQFTDKELDDMEAVDNAVSELLDSAYYKNLSYEDKKTEVLKLLNKLADEGTPERNYSLIVKESIFAGDDTVSYSYSCGVSGGVMLKEFDKYMN